MSHLCLLLCVYDLKEVRLECSGMSLYITVANVVKMVNSKLNENSHLEIKIYLFLVI